MNEYELKTKMHRITQAKRAMSGAFDIDFMDAQFILLVMQGASEKEIKQAQRDFDRRRKKLEQEIQHLMRANFLPY